MEKKSVILLIVSTIILILAVVFAVWSFKIDSNVQQEQLANSEETNNISFDENNNVEEHLTEENLNEESKTKDLEVTYTEFVISDSNGNQIKLSDYKDTPVMVLFWNPENEDANEMLKRVNSYYEEYKDEITFITICNTEDYEIPDDIKLPIYEDANQEVINLYGIKEFPAMLYINKENEIFNSKTGLTTYDALKANLDILAENF